MEQHLPLVKTLARQQRRRLSVDHDELVSSGTMGLVRAAQLFDLERGVPFSAYARRWILGSMLDAARAELSVQRPVENLDESRQASAEAQPGDALVASEQIGALAAFDGRTRHILRERLRGRSLKEIGNDLGLSEARIGQIAGRAKAVLMDDAEAAPESSAEPLTPAQVEALCGAAQGETTKETAGRLGKSVWTVRSQKNEALRRLGARSITHAVVRALLDGVLSLDDLGERWTGAGSTGPNAGQLPP